MIEPSTYATGVEPRDLRLWKICHFGRGALGRDVGGTACIVDDIGDLAFVVKRDRDHVMESHTLRPRNFNRAREVDVGVAEDAIDAQTPRLDALSPCPQLCTKPSP